MKNKKTPIESLMLILDASRWNRKPSKIFKVANVDIGPRYGKRYLEILYVNGMVAREKSTPKRYVYKITRKGRDLLDEYEALLLVFKELQRN